MTMKFLPILILALSPMWLWAQDSLNDKLPDMIVEMTGDTINCYITSVDDKYIIYSRDLSSGLIYSLRNVRRYHDKGVWIQPKGAKIRAADLKKYPHKIVEDSGDTLQVEIVEVNTHYIVYNDEFTKLFNKSLDYVDAIHYKNEWRYPKKPGFSVIYKARYDIPFEDRCKQGREDARVFHQRTGPNILLGFLTGPIGIAANALSSPEPNLLAVGNSTLIKDDVVYESCYVKRARGKNVAAAAGGMAVWLVVLGVWATGK